MSAQATDFFDDLRDRATHHIARRAGVSRQVAIEISRDLAAEMSEHWGGSQPYLPRTHARNRQHENILVDSAAGMSVAALAQKYRKSEQRIRQILNAMRKT